MTAWFFRVLLLVIASAIFVIANLPSQMVPFGSAHDKLNHAAAFASLTFLVAAAFPSARPLWVFSSLMVFNTVIELSQRALGFGRQAEFLDWIAGAAASAFVLLLLAIAKAIRRMVAG